MAPAPASIDPATPTRKIGGDVPTFGGANDDARAERSHQTIGRLSVGDAQREIEYDSNLFTGRVELDPEVDIVRLTLVWAPVVEVYARSGTKLAYPTAVPFVCVGGR